MPSGNGRCERRARGRDGAREGEIGVVAAGKRLLGRRKLGRLSREKHVTVPCDPATASPKPPSRRTRPGLRGDLLEPRAEGLDRRGSDDAIGLRSHRPLGDPLVRRDDLVVAIGLRRSSPPRPRAGLVVEVEEVDNVTRLREVGAPAPSWRTRGDRSPRASSGAPLLRCGRGSPSHAFPSACSRSAQSASGSSSPTESRSRPGGTRSPSQRERASIRDVTPPRLVMFAISFVLVSTRARPRRPRRRRTGGRRSPGSGRSRRRVCPKPLDDRRALAVWRARRTSSVSRPRSRSQAVSGPGNRAGPRRNSSRRAASPGRGRRRRRRARRRGRRGTSSRSGARGRSRARAA